MNRYAEIAWRIAVLALLAWLIFEVRGVRREMPSGGLDYDAAQQLRSMSIDSSKANDILYSIERNTRR